METPSEQEALLPVPHIRYKKFKANFCGREKEGHFQYKNFLRALKWAPTWYTYTVGTKSLLFDWLQFSESQSESRDFVPTV